MELEGIAESAYAEAELDPERPHLPRLAKALLGPRAIERGPRPLHAPACLVRVRGEWRIIVGRNLPPRFALFAVGHELAHWLLGRVGFVGEDEEAVADALAAALLMPRPAFRRALLSVGDDWSELARVMCATETAVALRLGEVTRRPLAVVAPARVRVRGDEEWLWPDESTIRQWARKPLPGLRKTKLKDDPRRVVLAAAEI